MLVRFSILTLRLSLFPFCFARFQKYALQEQNQQLISALEQYGVRVK
jgi:hypothetical protein